MFKGLFKYVFVILSAAYFLLAGAGYNIVNYCCDSCAHAGIEEVAHTSCDALHKHEHESACQHEQEDLACSNINHQTDGCHLLRVKVDTPAIQTTAQLLNNTIQSIDLFYVSELFLIEFNPDFFRTTVPPPNLFIHSTGREILALHAVLLI